MSVKLNLQIPDGVQPGQLGHVKFKQDQKTDHSQRLKSNGNFDLVLALQQTCDRVKGIIDAFAHLPIAGSLTIVATSSEYRFEGELTAYTAVANNWQEKMLAMIDSAVYSMRHECGDVLTEFRMTLTQTCTWTINID